MCIQGPAPPRNDLLLVGQETIALRFLPSQFTGTTYGFGLFTHFGRLFIGSALLKFPNYTFALHFLLENSHCLINVVITNQYLQNLILSTK